MSKLKIVMLVSLVMLTWLIISSEYKVQPQNKVSSYNKLSPTEIMKLYWKSSVEGNEETLKQITTITPPAFNHVCQENGQGQGLYDSGSGNLKKENAVYLLEEPSKKDYSPIITTKQSSFENDKFVKETADDSPVSLAYHTARYLYVSKSPLSRVRIKNETIYNDESVVEVEYNLTENVIYKYSFFLINQDGWKIFNIIQSDSVDALTRYAMPRPKCSSIRLK
jgi:hypothetical protein